MHLVTPLDAPAVPVAPERFAVTDRDSAAWAIRKLRRARAEFVENQAIAEREFAETAAERAKRCEDLDAEDARTAAWLAAEMAKLEETERNLGAVLTEWHRQVVADDPREWAKKRCRTLKFSDGELRARRPADEWLWHDEDAFVAWARETSPDLVRTTYAPAKAEVKKALGFDQETGEVVDADGVVVPGVSVQGSEVTFTVVTP